MSDEGVPWEAQCLTAAEILALRCQELRDSNPYNPIEFPVLSTIAPALVTELWDRGFSVTEITAAFAGALSDLPRYAASEDRRGDKSRD
jgi:hypothetical protein